MARSSLMWGRAGVSPMEPSSVTRGGRKRRKCTASGWASLPRLARSAGRSPGNTAASAVPSNTLRPSRSPGSGTPTMHGSRCQPERASASRVALSAASAITLTSAPANLARAIALSASARRIASSRSWLV